MIIINLDKEEICIIPNSNRPIMFDGAQERVSIEAQYISYDELIYAVRYWRKLKSTERKALGASQSRIVLKEGKRHV